MISKEVKKYCRDFTKIENYDKAMSDTTQTWDCHHRLETHNSDGERRLVDISEEELIALGMYFDRPPEELIFMTSKEHHRLHPNGMKGKHHTKEARRKMSDARKGRIAWNKGKKGVQTAWNKGKPMSEEQRKKLSKPKSEEWKRKISEAHIGKHHSEETRRKMSDTLKDRMAKEKDAYKQYKTSGGNLKWNDFRKQYKGEIKYE